MVPPFIFIFLLSLVLCLPESAYTQTVQPCDKWAVEVCQSPLNTLDYGDPGCTNDCHRVHYYFYLIRKGSENSTSNDETFTFSDLSVTGTLSVSQGSVPTGMSLSEVNIAQSVACSTTIPGLNQGTPNSPLLNYDVQSNQFTYQVSPTTGNYLNWTVYGRFPLFVLTVDVYPGETVQPTGMTSSFTVMDGSGTVNCTNQTVITCGTADDLNKNLLPLTDCTSTAGSPTFKIGNAENVPVNGFPNRKRMLVWVSGPANTTFSWNVTYSPFCSSGSCLTVTEIPGNYLMMAGLNIVRYQFIGFLPIRSSMNFLCLQARPYRPIWTAKRSL